MADHRTFKGFFSYAHHDADTDPGLIRVLTTDLELRVNAKLANARFVIWRDKEALRTGELWNEKIEAQVRGADVLIVLLTPRWIESDYCRKEYSVFEEVEASRTVGSYVAPVLVRPVEQQERYFTPEQRRVHALIAQRQYFRVIATGFLKRTSAQRVAVIDEIADDISGMIERLRDIPATADPLVSVRRHPHDGAPNEFSGLAQDYAEVDFLRSYEVLIDRAQDSRERGIYAQLDFVERLFVKTQKAYVEFGISRAYLSIEGAAPGELLKFDDFRTKDVRRAAYVTLHEIRDALSIEMNAGPGRGLAELALPPTDGNYWSRIATATSEVRREQLQATLRVTFSTYGLHIADEKSRPLPQATARKIEAIVGVALSKHEHFGQGSQIRRSVPIRERTE